MLVVEMAPAVFITRLLVPPVVVAWLLTVPKAPFVPQVREAAAQAGRGSAAQKARKQKAKISGFFENLAIALVPAING
jgi:hypothetical protein